MGAGELRRRRAAALHGVPSRLQAAGQAADATADAAPCASHRPPDGAQICLRGQYSLRRRQYDLSGMPAACDHALLACGDVESIERWLLRELRNEDRRGIHEAASRAATGVGERTRIACERAFLTVVIPS